MAFNEKIDFIFGDIPEPYYAIRLTKEQVELVWQRTAEIVKVDGKVMFPVKENGEKTGEYVIFVKFKA